MELPLLLTLIFSSFLILTAQRADIRSKEFVIEIRFDPWSYMDIPTYVSDTAFNSRIDVATRPENLQSSSPTKKKLKTQRKKLRIWIFGFFIGGISSFVLGLLLSVLYKVMVAIVERRRRKTTRPAIFSPLIKAPGDLKFLEDEDEVSAMEIVGRGGCGVVYKAILPGDRYFAVKEIKPPETADDNSRRRMKQVRSEIVTVGRIRHRNLVPLLAHVTRDNYHYLVYPFMKNGSLKDALQAVSEDGRRLEWRTRYKIAVGVSLGLEYLHSQHGMRILHKDLKPANILLDDDMEAMIADFGLAKIMPDGGETHVTVSQMEGTFGYIAPEYNRTLKYTDKCDVYSFGVVLGALVIGKLPTDEFFLGTREHDMVKWMRNRMDEENTTEVIDSTLLGNGYEEEMLLVLKVACFCTLDDPDRRPSARQAKEMLSQIGN